MLAFSYLRDDGRKRLTNLPVLVEVQLDTQSKAQVQARLAS